MLRKSVFAAIVLLLVIALSQVSFAQYTKVQAVAATATVYTALNTTSVNPVAFSNIDVNVNPWLAPTGYTTTPSSGVGGSATPGGFTVTGSIGANIKITWAPAQATLSDGTAGALHTLKFTPFSNYAGANSQYLSGSTVALDGSGNGLFSVGGTLYANDGSSVVPNNQTAANYTTVGALGTPITFTIDYVL